MQFLVLGITEPSQNFYPVIPLSFEIILNIVNYYSFWEISAKSGKVFYVDAVVILAVLTVESVINIASILVNIVQNKICIVFCRSSENDYLENLGHFLKELYTTGPKLELFLLSHEMHKGFVKV